VFVLVLERVRREGRCGDVVLWNEGRATEYGRCRGEIPTRACLWDVAGKVCKEALQRVPSLAQGGQDEKNGSRRSKQSTLEQLISRVLVDKRKLKISKSESVSTYMNLLSGCLSENEACEDTDRPSPCSARHVTGVSSLMLRARGVLGESSTYFPIRRDCNAVSLGVLLTQFNKCHATVDQCP
jgi:hypothetical protein